MKLLDVVETEASLFTIVDTIILLDNGTEESFSFKDYEIKEFIKGTVLDEEVYAPFRNGFKSSEDDILPESEYFDNYKNEAIIEYYLYKKGAK